MDFDPDEIIDKIKILKRRIDEMDERVKKYLSDRKRYPHPGHENLVSEIQKFENQIHKLPNSDVHFWLEGLLHSLMVHQRIWRTAFDKDEEVGAGKREFPIDRLYSVVTKKLDQLGKDAKVTKKELFDKLLPEYTKKKKHLKKDERITWSLNKETNEVQIKVEKKE